MPEGLWAVLNQNRSSHISVSGCFAQTRTPHACWAGGVCRVAQLVQKSVAVCGCIGRQVCTREGVSSIITPAPGLFEHVSLSGRRRKKERGEWQWPGNSKNDSRLWWNWLWAMTKGHFNCLYCFICSRLDTENNFVKLCTFGNSTQCGLWNANCS